MLLFNLKRVKSVSVESHSHELSLNLLEGTKVGIHFFCCRVLSDILHFICNYKSGSTMEMELQRKFRQEDHTPQTRHLFLIRLPIISHSLFTRCHCSTVSIMTPAAQTSWSTLSNDNVTLRFFFFNIFAKFLHFCCFLSRWGAACTLMRNKMIFFDFGK